MTDSKNRPSRKDRLRPIEFIVISAIAAVFVGLVVLLSTRGVVLALVFAGIAFIVCLVIIAMLMIGVKPGEGQDGTFPVLGDPNTPHKSGAPKEKKED